MRDHVNSALPFDAYPSGGRVLLGKPKGDLARRGYGRDAIAWCGFQCAYCGGSSRSWQPGGCADPLVSISTGPIPAPDRHGGFRGRPDRYRAASAPRRSAGGRPPRSRSPRGTRADTRGARPRTASRTDWPRWRRLEQAGCRSRTAASCPGTNLRQGPQRLLRMRGRRTSGLGRRGSSPSSRRSGTGASSYD